jgi:streptogramin lyase
MPPSEDGSNAEGVAIGPEGDIYFGLWNPSALWKLESTAGTFSKVTSLSSGVPQDLAFSPVNGHLFTALSSTDIAEYFNGVGTPNYYGPTEGDLFFLTVDSAGNVWTGAETGVDEVPYASGGKVVTYPSSNTSSRIQAVTVDHSGNIWFTDRGNDSIGEISPAEGAPHITEYPIPHPSGGSSAAEPYDITTAANGSVWFTESDGGSFEDSTNNQIGEVTSVAGESTVVFSMQATPDKQQPQAITADAAGNVWYSAGDGNSSDELGKVTGAATGGKEGETPTKEKESPSGSKETTTTTTTSSAVVETVTTSTGESITLATAPGEAGYAELDKHLLGGLSGNDIAKLLANSGFSIQIPLSYPAYPGNYSAGGSASPEGIPGYDGEGVNGGEYAGSGGNSFAVAARKKSHHLAPVVLFHYQHTYTTAGTYKVKVHFTAAGLKLLRAAARAHRNLKVSVTLSLTATGHTPIHQKLSTTLKPGPRKSHKH